ncbi:Putative NADH:flavin oxidoreductase/NADH oxidase, aldolase-type TIM barrel, oxidoreductase Oye [Colletotrichum destructivum]|uniref:NADH:flavin oxidoreductase/NADH oxidase, aldolase-type TIM barrel, oxidoreductase Oye n=1 Tax=Colletotrichum destructivum TaxID=34406 RepID=A0AAX4IND7_9PEZI|nr:Putative NADH:flavin oxidoreductase/NADH oxidase, aldolase-type TIM barrel, oxidoreductase Oye [Colletotrichum destructivum]
MAAENTKLFQPLKVGKMDLAHRVAMAPLTRYRADDDSVPLPIVPQYYADRASAPGTLIITEATAVSPADVGDLDLPDFSTPAQIAAWKNVFDAIHAKGSYVFQQLWSLGRAADPSFVKGRGYKYCSSSDIQMTGRPCPPEALTEEEIWEKINSWRVAARNVVAAGGDGIEIHGAHGYLVDQFTRDSVNKRTDKWGGSVENRARFLLEIIKAVVDEIGAERVALRLSPFATFQESYSSDTWEQTSYIIREIKKAGYKLAYLSLVEAVGNPVNLGIVPRQPTDDVQPFDEARPQTLDFILEEWDNQSPVIVAGGYLGDSARWAVDERYAKWDVAVAFGRYFISNPDLVFRVKNRIPFAPYDRTTFYKKKSNDGYNTYEFSNEYVKAHGSNGSA